MAKPLTKKAFHEALVFLKDRNGDLASIFLTIGPPPMRHHEPGFPFLVHIILEQQVSLASAKAAFDRLVQALPALTPNAFLKLE
jgi:DNA-3-methyladenine glycosylase II